MRITLAEKGLPWEGFHLSLRKGEARTEEYKKLNPNGVVPTLITENGTVIIESTVILEYLDDAYPDIPLKPDDPHCPRTNAVMDKKLDEGIHVNLATVSNAGGISIPTHRRAISRGAAGLLQCYPDPERRARTIDLVSHGTNSKYFGPAIHCFDTLFAEMDAALEQGTWLTGSQYSLADIAYMPYLTRFDHLGLLGIPNHRPHLRHWYRRSPISLLRRWDWRLA